MNLIQRPNWSQWYLGIAQKIVGNPLARTINGICFQKVTILRKYCWNEHFLDEPTPEGAYIIGLFIADGYLRSDSEFRHNYQVCIVQKNDEILKRIAGIIGYNGKIRSVSNAKQLALNSKHIHNVLTQKYGIPAGRTKSYTVRLPEIISDSPSLLRHCIRGIFDGDGYIAKDATCFSFSSGSSDLLDDLMEVLKQEVGLSVPKRKWASGSYIKKNGKKSGAHYLIYIGILDTIDFAKFIYGPSLNVWGSSLYLERKRNRFQSAYNRWRGREWLQKEIEEKGRTCGDIAAELGVRKGTVTILANKIGVYDFPFKNPKWLRKEIKDNGRSSIDIANEFSADQNLVRYYANKFGIIPRRHRARMK